MLASSQMGRRYATELEELEGTYAWAMEANIETVAGAVARAAHRPLVAVGSGGALSVAHALVHMHRVSADALALTSTPLLLEESVPKGAGTSVWILSAGGRNADIRSALRAAALREPQQLVVLCGNPSSPLVHDAHQHSWVECPTVSFPSRDGFLATNSVVGFAVVLARAYASLVGESLEHQTLAALLSSSSPNRADDIARCQPLWSRQYLVVLFGPSTTAAAFDLESRFTEAGLGAVQLADFRNFAHGRHHWLAKHGDDSAVLALVGTDDRALAHATLRALPEEIPKACVDFDGSDSAIVLTSLVVAMQLAGEAGRARSIDPGRPGVPDFGRRLYHMKVPRSASMADRGEAVPSYAETAIVRKTRCAVSLLRARGSLTGWTTALAACEATLSATEFRGLVCDYDGTVVESRLRTEPPQPEIVAELVRLLRGGIHFGIATGRGDSVCVAARQVLPEDAWDRVLVGYHNGATVQSLAEEPALERAVAFPALDSAAELLRSESALQAMAGVRLGAEQITVSPAKGTSEERLWNLVTETLYRGGLTNLRVIRSSHSVDVIPASSSKRNVLEAVRRASGGHVLAVGDRGCWPGNDYDLLASTHALSVDEVSADPDAAWNLAPAGHRGVGALLYYLRAMRLDGYGFRLDLGASRV